MLPRRRRADRAIARPAGDTTVAEDWSVMLFA
jgi:hypothetical protein